MAAEFSRRTKGLLDKAEEVCRQRGANLTELRRHVLGLGLGAVAAAQFSPVVAEGEFGAR